MKRIAVAVLAVAVLAMAVSGAWAGDKIKVKSEYYTPYGKVKVKEYYYPGAYPYYGYQPAYNPYYYNPGYYAPPPSHYPPNCPGTYYNQAPYGYGYGYGVPYKVKIDD